ncbi:hypothetical protein F5144DRAFT_577983 [Chaetomium tenue]|uniref:Uncharacterized protein n=1 Tax=Chaetomium tenue TaxID=1854479 RepID=A0ACB7P2E7_9PEZI|nr:hypothetical protein F5144DRAFT_577983 [Chaetomium globosum]
MNFIQRKHKPRPFAANSTGRTRGTLNLGARTGRVQVYEAIGEARDIFVEKISKAIVSYLNDHNDKLQSSVHFVDLSLFMMGKSPNRTKPIVMFVSDDKQTRTDAFRMIKNSGVMDDYPDFGLGEMELKAEFENLQFLLSDDQTEPASSQTTVDRPPSGSFLVPKEFIEVFGTNTGLWEEQRLEVRIQDGWTTNARRAVGGGVVSCRGVYMLHSVDHFLPTTRPGKESIRNPSRVFDANEVDGQVLGLSDDDEEDDDELADITSHGSASPATSDCRMFSGSSLGYDDRESSVSSSGSLEDQDTRAHSPDLPSPSETLTASGGQSFETATNRSYSARIGDVIWRSTLLDSAFIRIDTAVNEAGGSQFPGKVIPLESYQNHIEVVPSDTEVKIYTPDGVVDGMLSAAPSFIRLPGSKVFQEVYVAKLNKPLSQGDSGSWIKNPVTGKLFGHVIAGSTTTGLVLLVPAAKVFAAAFAAFSAPEEKLRPRTRNVGCSFCRMRKIKCDGALPSCRNCVRFERECAYSANSEPPQNGLYHEWTNSTKEGNSTQPTVIKAIPETFESHVPVTGKDVVYGDVNGLAGPEFMSMSLGGRKGRFSGGHTDRDREGHRNSMFGLSNEQVMQAELLSPTTGNRIIIPALFSRDWTGCFVSADLAESAGCQINPVPTQHATKITPFGVIAATGMTTSWVAFAEHVVFLSLLVFDNPPPGLSETGIIIGRDIIERLPVSNEPSLVVESDTGPPLQGMYTSGRRVPATELPLVPRPDRQARSPA